MLEEVFDLGEPCNEEEARRQYLLKHAVDSAALEGRSITAETAPYAAAIVRGEMTASEAIERAKARHDAE